MRGLLCYNFIIIIFALSNPFFPLSPPRQIFQSNNYGISGSWSAVSASPTASWNTISISADAQYQSAGVHGGNIYISPDSGSMWLAKDSSRYWYSVSVSPSGQNQTAIENNGYIYTSSNYGTVG